jgi:hypothetical protein
MKKNAEDDYKFKEAEQERESATTNSTKRGSFQTLYGAITLQGRLNLSDTE